MPAERRLRVVRRTLAVAGVVVMLVCAGDWLRVGLLTREATVETLTFYVATPLKNGKVEVFYD